MLRTFAFLLGILCCGAASAADIRVVKTDAGDPVVIFDGPLVVGDDYTFVKAVSDLKKATIELTSTGGETVPALFIGRLIRQRGYTTYIPMNAICASACAYIWLGGKTRIIGQGAKIGFHTSYQMQNGVPIPSEEGNSLIGSYIAEMGYSFAVMSYVIHAPPKSMQWLTAEDSERLGLNSFIETEINPLAH